MRVLLFVHFGDCRVKSDGFLKFFFFFLAFTFETARICLLTEIITIINNHVIINSQIFCIPMFLCFLMI